MNGPGRLDAWYRTSEWVCVGTDARVHVGALWGGVWCGTVDRFTQYATLDLAGARRYAVTCLWCLTGIHARFT